MIHYHKTWHQTVSTCVTVVFLFVTPCFHHLYCNEYRGAWWSHKHAKSHAMLRGMRGNLLTVQSCTLGIAVKQRGLPEKAVGPLWCDCVCE
jgi:hypothetical protein